MGIVTHEEIMNAISPERGTLIEEMVGADIDELGLRELVPINYEEKKLM